MSHRADNIVQSGPSTIGSNTSFQSTEGTDFINSGGNTCKVVINFPTGAGERRDGNENSIPDPIETLKTILPHLLEEIRKIQSPPEVEEATCIGGSSALLQTTTEIHQNQEQPEDGETTGIGCSSALLQAMRTGHASYNFEHGAVDITNIVPSDPSSLPVPTSIADKYTRTMLKCLAGYPLYKPKPFNKYPTTYVRKGIRVGDVGFIRENGAFDILFNICPSQNDSINPPGLPTTFTLQESEDSEIYDEEEFAQNTHLFHDPVYRRRGALWSIEYACSDSEGAILELPEGATRFEVLNRLPFKELAIRYGVEWYRYTMSRGRDITNGSLYLVTSSTKCIHWGIAVVERPCLLWEPGLQFSHTINWNRFISLARSIPKYYWSDCSTFTTTAAPIPDPLYENEPNQCVFLRGYKIRLREDIWNDLNDERRRGKSQLMFSSSPHQAGNTTGRGEPSNQDGHRQHEIGSGTRPGQGRSEPGTDADRYVWEPTVINPDLPIMESDEVILHANFNPPPAHPSDLINTALLSQESSAKIAITHDDAWCDLLQGIFLSPRPLDLGKVARSFTSFTDDNGCISFEKTGSTMPQERNQQCNPAKSDTEHTYIPMPQIPASDAGLGVTDDSSTSVQSMPSLQCNKSLVLQEQASTQSETKHRTHRPMRLNNYVSSRQLGELTYHDHLCYDNSGVIWTSEVQLNGTTYGQGTGRHQKEARETAAARALEILQSQIG